MALELIIGLGEHIFISWTISKLGPVLTALQHSESLANVKQMPKIKVSDQISAEEASKLPATISKILGVSFVHNEEQTADVVNVLKMLNAQPVFRIILNSNVQEIDGGAKVKVRFHGLNSGGGGGLCSENAESKSYFIDVDSDKHARGLQRGIADIAQTTIHEFTHLICWLVFQNHAEPFRKGDFRGKVVLQKALQADYEFCKKGDTPEHKKIVQAFDIVYQLYSKENNIENDYDEDVAYIITALAIYGNKFRTLMPKCWDYLVEHFLPAIATEQDQKLVQDLQRDKEIDLDLQDPETHRPIPTVIFANNLERAIKTVGVVNKLMGVKKATSMDRSE
ncbi:hypothetical protein RLOatenuis_0290 [Rickettsiales bacterium]|nr:hypothetical protein RLOatenuis_0290 [Rickettsiales bacterium]